MRKNHQLTFEALTWIAVILVTVATMIFLPWYLAQNILFYLLILSAIAAVGWYIKSRRLILESEQKTKEITSKQKELKNRQKTLDLIFDNSADGILIIDNEQKIINFSPGMEKMTGYRKEEVLGRNAQKMLKFSGDKENSLLPDMMFLPKELKKNPYIKNSLISKEGRQIDIEASYTPVAENGKTESLAIIRDITYETELIRRDKEFIAVTSHQLNTPLSIIRGYVSLLMNEKTGELNEKQKEQLEQIYKATIRTITITNSLLSVSRIEQDRIKIELEDFNLYDILLDIKNDFEQQASEKNIKLILEQEDKNIIIYADGEKLVQALNNIIDNALKYTIEGSVTISAIKSDRQAIIKIKDTGIGIPLESIDKIGTKFYRTQGAIDVDNKGTGLGLNIAKTIIEKHEGEMLISSEVGKGTEITISLPLI